MASNGLAIHLFHRGPYVLSVLVCCNAWLGALQHDMAIVGGGATDLGMALNAAIRALQVVSVDLYDLAKGASTRSTKLVCTGMRYLARSNINLVQAMLDERTQL